jgi:hypothetical protein
MENWKLPAEGRCGKLENWNVGMMDGLMDSWNSGLWTLDCGLWTVDYKLINFFLIIFV